MTTLACLPSELLASILENLVTADLYACSLVSRLFYNAALSPLWRHVYIRSEQTLTKVITSMTTVHDKPGTHVRTLQLRTPELTDPLLLVLLQQVPSLTTLALEDAENITDTSFQYAARLCPQLQHISVLRGRITAASMMLPPSLHSLCLFFCPSLDNPMAFLANINPAALTQLDLTPCNLDSEDTKYFVAHAAAKTLARCCNLTQLRLANHNNDYTSFVTSAVAYGWTWPCLTHLSLDGCPGLEDAMLLPFLQAHPALQSVDISRSKITDASLVAMATHLLALQCVTVMFNSALTATGVCHLVKQCPMLEKGVYLYGCDIYITDADFPKDLDSAYFDIELDYEGEDHMVTWLAGNSFFDEEK